ARGLTTASQPCVSNYDVPTHAADYVHRVGRTGRAGQEGRAYTLVLPEERRYVDAITKLTGKEIPRLEVPGSTPPEDEPETPRRAANNGARARKEPAEPKPAARKAASSKSAERPKAAAKPAEPAPAEKRAARAPAERPKAPPRPSRSEGPVIGMGDHVPLFMRRPIPNAELLPKLNDD